MQTVCVFLGSTRQDLDPDCRPGAREDVARLPLRAAIAFAARCLRRVQALGPQHEAVARAIGVAEAIGRGQRDDADPDLVAMMLELAKAASEEAMEIDRTQEKSHYAADTRPDAKKAEAAVAEGAAYAASRDAAGAVACAARAIIHQAISSCDSEPIGAVNLAIEDAKKSEGPKFWADYERISQAVRERGYNDETPVPPVFFGPL
jgi:hypothetical protein